MKPMKWKWQAVLYLAAVLMLVGSVWAQQQPTAPAVPGGPVLVIPIATAPAAGQPPPPTPGVPTLEVHQTPSPAAPAHWQDQIIWSLIVAYGLEFLKKCKYFPWLKQATTEDAKKWWGFVAAALTTAGVHVSINGSFWSEAGVGLSVVGFSAGAVKELLFQWASQQALYDKIVKPLEAASAVAVAVAPPSPAAVAVAASAGV